VCSYNTEAVTQVFKLNNSTVNSLIRHFAFWKFRIPTSLGTEYQPLLGWSSLRCHPEKLHDLLAKRYKSLTD